MGEYEKLQTQVHDCGECLKAFLLRAVEAQPHLEDHAGVIREHLQSLLRELDLLAGRLTAEKP